MVRRKNKASPGQMYGVCRDASSWLLLLVLVVFAAALPLANSLVTFNYLQQPQLQQPPQQGLFPLPPSSQPATTAQQPPSTGIKPDFSSGVQPQVNQPSTTNSAMDDKPASGLSPQLPPTPGQTASAPAPVGNTNNQQQQPQARDVDPVFRFQAISLNGTSVKLVWNLRSNAGHVDNFDIVWGPMPNGMAAYEVRNLDGSTRDYTITQLDPNVAYHFQLNYRAGNMAFKPHYAVIKPKVSHNEGANQVNREIMPMGLKAQAKSNNSIQLSWIEAEKPATLQYAVRVNFIRYHVVHSTTGTTSTLGTSNSDQQPLQNNPIQYYYLNATAPPDSRIIVQKLKPATEYAFAVKTAYYSPDLKRVYTQSSFSMDTMARTFDLEPTAPRNLTLQLHQPNEREIQSGSLGQLELSWMPPESPNGQLKGYQILYAIEDSNKPDEEWRRIEASGASTNNWNLSGISHGLTYYFKIRAQNQRGYSQDSETRQFKAPVKPPPAAIIQPTNDHIGSGIGDSLINTPIPQNNILLIIIICGFLVFSILALVVGRFLCAGSSSQRSRKAAARKSSNSSNLSNQQQQQQNGNVNGGVGAIKTGSFDDDSVSGLSRNPLLSNGGGLISANVSKASNFATAGLSTRMSTLARRRDNNSGSTASANGKGDYWISAMGGGEQGQHQLDNFSSSFANEKAQLQQDALAAVSIQDGAQQFATTQLASNLPEYQRFVSSGSEQLYGQHQQQSHYRPGHQFGVSNFDQMDSAAALMTLTRRQQQQLFKYSGQFIVPTMGVPTSQSRSSPNQQPPPPPPLNIEQQQHQLQHLQQHSIYGTHHGNSSTRSLRLHRPTLYDPVSGSFIQAPAAGEGPPNYNASSNNGHFHASTLMANQQQQLAANLSSVGNSNTLQFYPHQSSTLASRRSTNTLRSFQNATGGQQQQQVIYGQLAGGQAPFFGITQQQNSFLGLSASANTQQPQKVIQSHQAVINQLNQSSNNTALPLKHVSAVRPQIMSSLDDQIELELAEKEQQQHPQIGQQAQTGSLDNSQQINGNGVGGQDQAIKQ